MHSKSLIHFCANSNEKIKFSNYNGSCMAHHLYSKRFSNLKVCEFNEHDGPYFEELLAYLRSCLSVIDVDCELYFTVRLGVQYYSNSSAFMWSDMNVNQFSHYINNIDSIDINDKSYFKFPIEDKERPHPAFNSESGVHISEFKDVLLDYIKAKGFSIDCPERIEEIKIVKDSRQCKSNIFVYDAETLNLSCHSGTLKCGNFDLIHSKDTPYIKDIRLQISGVLDTIENAKTEELLKRDENNNLELTCDPKSVAVVVKEDLTVYDIQEHCNQLKETAVQMKLDKKTKFDHHGGRLKKSMTNSTGIHLLFTCKRGLFNDEDYTLKFVETLIDHMDWLSRMTTELQINSKESIFYFNHNCNEGFSYTQELFMRNVLKKSKDYYALFNVEKSEFRISQVKNEYNNLLAEVERNTFHPKYSVVRYIIEKGFEVLSDPITREKYDLDVNEAFEVNSQTSSSQSGYQVLPPNRRYDYPRYKFQKDGPSYSRFINSNKRDQHGKIIDDEFKRGLYFKSNNSQ